ncbi:MAG TPA: nucleoside kinase [Kiritimatiellia bacterium]|nr:nucleoside kinase [Kiritimatiellia bacterium]HMP33628.1 nucleoside kinase [Kiritimatiellia bacterium]
MHQKGQITARLNDGRSVTCAFGTPVEALLEKDTDEAGRHYLGAMVNNLVVTLEFLLEVDSDVQFLTFADSNGWRIYRSTACFLLAKAVKDLFPDAKLIVEHSMGTGFYCSFEQGGQEGMHQEQLDQVRARLKDIIAANAPIERRKVLYADAVRHFEEQGQPDKANLLKFRNPPKVVVYTCDGYTDLAHGPLAHSSGAITHVDLIHVGPGFVIQFPDRGVPPKIPTLRPQPQLFAVFQEHKKWGRILGVNTVGRLNGIIAAKESADFIRIAEALHEKKIAKVADKIKEERERIKFILIAGPSSSGKTTFAKRLSVQLRVNGLNPVAISVDNYFVDRDKTPRDEKGEYDFEHIEAIDLALFNQHLSELVAGEKISLPRFNFEQGLKEYPGEFLQLKGDQVVILEGIHCLNPRLTASIPAENKFKIYISALTQLGLDSHNRVATTDNRLVRRLVRDNQFRGHSALTTMKMWPSVRRGEKTWIFPFQEEADLAFNSALDYELAVLKPFVEPLLAEVKPHDPQYAEARRLQEFLGSFLGIPHDLVPPTSLLREFIGKSSFRY